MFRIIIGIVQLICCLLARECLSSGIWEFVCSGPFLGLLICSYQRFFLMVCLEWDEGIESRLETFFNWIESHVLQGIVHVPSQNIIIHNWNCQRVWFPVISKFLNDKDCCCLYLHLVLYLTAWSFVVTTSVIRQWLQD